MSQGRLLAIGAAMAAAILATPAIAADASVRYELNLRAVVPVVCRVELSAAVVSPNADGVVDLGAAQEFCNAPRGYRVLIQHAPNLQNAALIVEGVRIPLSASGETVLTDSSHAAQRSVRVLLDLGDASRQLSSMGLRIEAKA